MDMGFVIRDLLLSSLLRQEAKRGSKLKECGAQFSCSYFKRVSRECGSSSFRILFRLIVAMIPFVNRSWHERDGKVESCSSVMVFTSTIETLPCNKELGNPPPKYRIRELSSMTEFGTYSAFLMSSAKMTSTPRQACGR